MANKTLFKQKSTVPAADTTNLAGGKAYSMTDRHALAQLAATGTFNGTFYSTPQDGLAQVKTIVERLVAAGDFEYIAKVAVYARRRGYMKDMPAYLVAALAANEPRRRFFAEAFDRVIDNGKMLRNFVQICRSGQAGGKKVNFTSGSVRKAIQRWFDKRDDEAIFKAVIGNDPTLASIIRAARVEPKDKTREAFFKYILDREYDAKKLPKIVAHYERFKKGNRRGGVPKVDFRYLDSLPLETRDWESICANAGWTMTRMNLNTFLRKGVFSNPVMIDKVVDRLRDRDEIKKARAFPYQLMTAYKNADNVPHLIREALQDAMEIAVENVPTLEGKVVIAIDVSGSMGGAITGYRPGATSVVRCVDVAAMYAACILRKNPSATILAFNHGLGIVKANPRDTIFTVADGIARLLGGGTNCSLPLAYLNQQDEKADTVIYISDNESWIDRGYGNATGVMTEWEKFKRNNKGANLVCIDLTPNVTSQVKEYPNILQVGGFSDTTFDVIDSFVKYGTSSNHWVEEIENFSDFGGQTEESDV